MQRAALLIALYLASAGAQGQSAFLSPAIDRTLFAEGAVKRMAAAYEGWHLVCDEIARLRQRFCSLRSRAFDAHGIAVANIVISTSDTGKPTALITLAYGILLPAHLAISLRLANKKLKILTSLDPSTCAAGGCTVIWSLPPAVIVAMRNGLDLTLNFKSAASVARFPGPRRFRVVNVAGNLAARGFNAALLASVQ